MSQAEYIDPVSGHFSYHIRPLAMLVLGLALLMGSASLCGQRLGHNISKLQDKYDQLGTVFPAKNAIIEDSLGYLWIGTTNGLCRYSGSTINCYSHVEADAGSIDGNRVLFVMMDSDHLIWTAIDEVGINVFDIAGRKILDFEYDKDSDRSLLHNSVWGMWEDDDGYIWISYFHGGISRYDKVNDHLDHYTIDEEETLKDQRPRTVIGVEKHKVEPHTYWLATTGGLVKFNTRNQEFMSFHFEQQIKEGTTKSQYNKTILKPIWTRSMCADSRGNLWLGTFGGVVKFDTESEGYEILRELEGSILNIVPGVINHDDNHILISYSRGLALIHVDTHALTILTDEDGNSPDHKLYGRFYRAQNGCLYILNRAGDMGGIYKYCDFSDMVHDYRTGHYITNLVVTDNYLYYHRNTGQIESRNLKSRDVVRDTFEIENTDIIRAMAQKSGDTILVSDFYYLYEYHPKSGLKKIEEFSQANVSRHESIFVDSDGDIWNGRQRSGIFQWDKDSKKVTLYNHETNPSIAYQDYIVDIIEDQDRDIWIATEQGWTIFNKGSNTTRNYVTKNVDIIGESGARTIKAIAQTSDGRIWIATSSRGLFSWSKDEERILKHINEKTGLYSDRIYDVKVDEDDNLWLATRNGISWVNSETHEIKNFGNEFGISDVVYCLDFDGRKIYAGHHSGYYSFDIDTLLAYERPHPQPAILGFELYDQKQDSLLYMDGGISLAHDQNFFAFSYGSLNYFDPHLERYQYRLTGIDKKWIDDKSDRRKGYTNIDPGTYEFQVRIRTTLSDWTDPAIVKIEIRPAWYQTIWIKLLAMLLTGLMIWMSIRFYIKRQKRNLEIDKRFAQLETMVLKSQMNPHFMFNSLNSIRYLFMKDEKEKGLQYITKFARLLRTTLHHGDQAQVKLIDEIELTELYIELEKLRFDDSLKFTTSYLDTADWQDVPIPPFVIQPIVENAFWHGLLPSKSTDKHLHISISQISGGFRVIVEDNGVGLSAKSEHSVDAELNKMKSYGLTIIKERFDLINTTSTTQYDLKVDDSINNETGVMATIEITTNQK